VRLPLDTDIGVAILRGRGAVRQRLEQVLEAGSVAFLSAVTAFELWHGVDKSLNADRNAEVLGKYLAGLAMLTFDGNDARMSATVAADLERRGMAIGRYDVLIAGQALARDLTLVTGNTREFGRVEGLRVEDWLHG
jgi:tRNA(fMet)-specific endonuclease VapC